MKYLLKVILSYFLMCGVAFADSDVLFQELLENHARVLESGKDDSREFVPALRKLATGGHKESQFVLGTMVLSGSIDAVEGINWLQQSEAKGCAGAAGILAMIFTQGDAIPKDETKGLEWLNRAAYKGDIGSQAMLSGLYGNDSTIVKKDIAQAYFWIYLYLLQTRQLNKPLLVMIGEFQLTSIEKQLSPPQIKHAKTLAEEQFIKQGGVNTYLCAHSFPN
jgi:TPR repeat protein